MREESKAKMDTQRQANTRHTDVPNSSELASPCRLGAQPTQPTLPEHRLPGMGTHRTPAPKQENMHHSNMLDMGATQQSIRRSWTRGCTRLAG